METSNVPLLNTYARSPVVLVKGEGSKLFDSEGKTYIDCLAGIAVVSVGHANPKVAEAVSDQMRKLNHVSNLFWNEPMMELAVKLRELTGWGRVFFANSGAEANECAIKLLRKWGAPKRYKIICMEGSFHGRTLATLAATGQPAKWQGFAPLPQGFVHVPFNNLSAIERAIDEETVAVMLEPIQGERGVIPADNEFLKGLRRLCTAKNVALLFDEIQCGMGRTGSWWSFQGSGVKPDVFTVAKALANGLPIGACIADEPFASSFSPGDHGTTFGGGPVAARAALATIEIISEKGFLENVTKKAELFKKLLSALPQIKEVRGKGLMIGAVLKSEKAGDVVKKSIENGLILNAATPDTLRLVPPLVISEKEIEQACQILAKSLADCIS